LISDDYKIHRTAYRTSHDKNPQYFFYERMSERLYVAYENSEFVEELKLEPFKPSIISALSCSKIDSEVKFKEGITRSRVDRVLNNIKKSFKGDTFDIATHKFTYDYKRFQLFHLCSLWKRVDIDETTGVGRMELQSQHLACYNVDKNEFKYKGRLNLSDIKNNILTIHGREDHRLRDLNTSAIIGIKSESCKEYDLQLSFESGQQIKLRVLENLHKFEILLHEVVHSYNSKIIDKDFDTLSQVRICNSGVTGLGQTSYIYFSVNNTGVFVIENDFSLSTPVSSGALDADSNPLPIDNCRSPTLSIVFRSENTDERICVSEIDSGRAQNMIDDARLGRFKFNQEYLEHFYMHIGHRKHIAVLQADTLRIIANANFSDVLYEMLRCLDIARDEQNDQLCNRLMKDLAYYSLKLGMNFFTSALLTILMSEDHLEFLVLDSITETYGDYIIDQKSKTHLNERNDPSNHSRVKQQAMQVLYSFGKMNDQLFRQKLFQELNKEAYFSRILESQEYGIGLVTEMSSRTYVSLLAFANITNSFWKKTIFNMKCESVVFDRNVLSPSCKEEEISLVIDYLRKLRKSLSILKSRYSIAATDDLLSQYLFEGDKKDPKNRVDYARQFKDSDSFENKNLKSIEHLFSSSGSKVGQTDLKPFKKDNTSLRISILEDDYEFLIGLENLICRVIEILNLIAQTSDSLAIQENLHPDIINALTTEQLYRLVLERYNELIVKRMLLHILTLETQDTSIYLKHYPSVINKHELAVFMALIGVQKAACKIEANPELMATVQIDGHISELKREIGSLDTLFIVDSSKGFIVCKRVEALMDLIISRMEFINEEIPKIKGQLNNLKKIVKSQDEEIDAIFSVHLSSENHRCNGKLMELTGKIDSLVLEMESSFRSTMSILIELSGLEETERRLFDLPEKLKQNKYVNKLWEKYRPQTKTYIIKHKLEDYLAKGKKPSILQRYLLSWREQDIKRCYINILKRMMQSSYKELRMKILSWMFGQGTLSLLDELDQHGANRQLTSDLCSLAQKEGIIDSNNGSESCIFLIENFIKRQRHDVVIELISKLLENSFIGKEGEDTLSRAEDILHASFTDPTINLVALQTEIEHVSNLGLPSLKTKLKYLGVGRDIIERGNITAITPSDRKRMAALTNIWESNSNFRNEISYKLIERCSMLSRILEFIDEVLKLGEPELEAVDSILFGVRTIQGYENLLNKYQQRRAHIRFKAAQMMLSQRILESKIIDRTELIDLYVKKFKLTDVYLCELARTFTGENLLQAEMRSGLRILLQENARYSSVESLLEYELPNTQHQVTYRELKYDLALEHPLIYTFLKDCVSSGYLYPQNFEMNFRNLILIRDNDRQLDLKTRFANLEQLFGFKSGIGELILDIEQQNIASPLVQFFLDRLGDFCYLERLGTELEYFKPDKKAQAMLALINEGGFDYLWLSNFFKSFISANPLLYCLGLEEVQKNYVKAVEGGSATAEIAFRYLFFFNYLDLGLRWFA